MESDFERPTSDGQNASPTQAQARAALDDLDRDGATLAARVITPPWYHPALGVITAVFASAHALPGTWSMTAIALGIVTIPVLMMTYTQQHGVAITKPAGPRSKRLMLAILAVIVTAMCSSLAIKFLELGLWWALVPAAITFVATVLLGRRYDEALRQEIAAPTGTRS